MTQKQYTRSFKGKLDGKTVNYFTKQLDYKIKDTQKRVDLVREILYSDGELDQYFIDYFNQDVKDLPQVQPYFKVNLSKTDALSVDNNVCKKLEQMTNYILFNKNSLDKNEKLEHSYMTDKRLSTRKRREESFNGMLDAGDVNGNSKVELELINNKNTKKAVKQKIFKKDLNNKYIKQIQDDIDTLKNQHDNGNLNLYTRLKYRKMMGQMKEDQRIAKDKLFGTIYFKSVLPDTTVLNFDSDTGYYDENGGYHYVSENRIDFSNKKHIEFLLQYYSDLRMQHYEDLNSDMKYILDTLDWLIDNCNTLSNVEKDIIIMQIDQFDLLEISDELKKNYGLDYSIPFLSNICKNRITKKIAQFYIDSYEEWFYTFKVKGDYKRCSKCGQNKLASKKYFSPKADGKDGLQAFCKECDVKRKKM